MDYKKLAQSVHHSQNQVRRDPKSFIPKLEAMLKLFDGALYKKPGKIPLRTNEGPAAIRECIDFLRSAKPLHELTLSDEISKACEDHANDIGPKNISGHNGSDGSSFSQRMERYGEWMGNVAENIDFGSETGDEVVISLMVDDGVSSRGHRKNMFNPALKHVGVGCSRHQSYGHCCVLDYASEYTPKGQKHSGKSHHHGHTHNDYSTPSSNPYTSNPSYNSYGSHNSHQPHNSGHSNIVPQQQQYGFSSNSQPGFSSGFPSGFSSGFDKDFDDLSSKFNSKLSNFNSPFSSQFDTQKSAPQQAGQSGSSTSDLSEMAKKEAPPGCNGWSINSNVSITNGKKKTKITINYKFPDGGSQQVIKEIVEN